MLMFLVRCRHVIYILEVSSFRPHFYVVVVLFENSLGPPLPSPSYFFVVEDMTLAISQNHPSSVDSICTFVLASTSPAAVLMFVLHDFSRDDGERREADLGERLLLWVPNLQLLL